MTVNDVDGDNGDAGGKYLSRLQEWGQWKELLVDDYSRRDSDQGGRA